MRPLADLSFLFRAMNGINRFLSGDDGRRLQLLGRSHKRLAGAVDAAAAAGAAFKRD